MENKTYNIIIAAFVLGISLIIAAIIHSSPANKNRYEYIRTKDAHFVVFDSQTGEVHFRTGLIIDAGGNVIRRPRASTDK